MECVADQIKIQQTSQTSELIPAGRICPTPKTRKRLIRWPHRMACNWLEEVVA
jgi:hypothetical protein